MAESSSALIFLAFLPLVFVVWLWMIISKPAIVFHASQIFFNFLAMCCFASVAAFQAKWKVGPSGLSAFTLFMTILGIFIASFMLAVPVVYERYDKLARLARIMKELRVGFILTGTGSTLSLLIAFIVTISAWTQAGCKNAENDPNADKGKDYRNALPGWCSTKKAAAIFLWLAFAAWGASLALLIWEWRKGGHSSFKSNKAKDPPFNPPTDHEAVASYDEDEDDSHSAFQHEPPVTRASDPFTDNNYAARPTSSAYSSAPSGGGRQSMDIYGAFQDTAPTGYSPGGYAAPRLPEPDLGPKVSRTMQYAADDPYAKVKASIQGGTTPPHTYSYPDYR
ncbi:hypothetical protein CYLTODRAFT_469764 [Cylindrobasidium torrendii FP15055 ss-10]|uniref:MARVEL domain-containing protein n=1 Tax=Cylindrobasidium torrendii FP15055 ss-10 TaxID=1314674 RepID=A0A0D7B1G7_9AGAR|nr:hypothetical protein CYLTODRAFT_469764 [Cylindrobasidium torrendii FP15055 ss-10]